MGDIVLGLGGTVDVEVRWDARVLERLGREYGIRRDELSTAAVISDERALIIVILAFLATGTGGERFVEASPVLGGFADRFDTAITLGGTGVRAGIALSSLGIPSVQHLVSIDDSVRRLLPASTRYVSSAPRDTLDPHLIVQYPAGARVRLGDEELVAPHPNRLIFANDLPNREMALSQELPAALERASAFLISGFNTMTESELLSSRLDALTAAMKHLPTEALVFYEDAGFYVSDFARITRERLLPRIDVYSMNEDELQGYLGRSVNLLSPNEVAEALRAAHDLIPAPALVVHSRYWAIAVGPEAQRHRAALESAVRMAATRYRLGDGHTAQDFAATAEFSRHSGGEEVVGRVTARLPSTGVAAFDIDTASSITVGLGDSFVGGFLAATRDGNDFRRTLNWISACAPLPQIEGLCEGWNKQYSGCVSGKGNMAVLVGNGLSIGFNPSLSLDSITKEMMQRIETDDEGGCDTVEAMRAIADDALPKGVTSNNDFELLVGAFGSERETLSNLGKLARLTSPSNAELREALKRSADFVDHIRDVGVSHVLEVIFDYSAAAEGDLSQLTSFIEQVLALTDGAITIGNLNYDTLLLAALMKGCGESFADLASGNSTTPVTLSGEECLAHALRRQETDFPRKARIKLLQLHGSLTYWTNQSDTWVKLTAAMVREHDLFGLIRKRETELRPVVVLANQKDKRGAVGRYPFSLAYDVFAQSLAGSERWLIIGYSFRDEVVNEMLRDAFEQYQPTAFLVVTKGELLTSAVVEDAFGWDRGSSNKRLSFFREGVETVVSSEQWRRFASRR